VWAYQLSGADIQDLDAAVDRVQALPVDLKVRFFTIPGQRLTLGSFYGSQMCKTCLSSRWQHPKGSNPRTVTPRSLCFWHVSTILGGLQRDTVSANLSLNVSFLGRFFLPRRDRWKLRGNHTLDVQPTKSHHRDCNVSLHSRLIFDARM